MSNARKRIVILGPTASGKTDKAAQIARKLNTCVISVDSRQCFKHLDIGTAKPSEALLKQVKHHYISEIEPDVHETAMDFRRRCDEWESKYPPEQPIVYAGGSTLYLQAVLFDEDEIPSSDPDNIGYLKMEEKEYGISTLYDRLKDADPQYANKMDGMNRHRIFRALDVYMQTGKPFSSFQTTDYSKPRAGFEVYGIFPQRNVLYERINQRVDEMIDAGLVDEVKQLLKNYPPDLKALQTVGYREIIAYLNGAYGFDEMAEKIKTNTRRYAKRQLTWFRRWEFIRDIEGLGV